MHQKKKKTWITTYLLKENLHICGATRQTDQSDNSYRLRRLPVYGHAAQTLSVKLYHSQLQWKVCRKCGMWRKFVSCDSSPVMWRNSLVMWCVAQTAPWCWCYLCTKLFILSYSLYLWHLQTLLPSCRPVTRLDVLPSSSSLTHTLF